MTGGFLDWIGRVVMLVLAGMVTLSIIGALAAISSGDIGTRMGLETRPLIADQPPLPETEPRGAAPKMESADEPAGRGVPGPSGVSPDPAASDPTRWLEAIAYALLALVGLAALASLLLWRGLRERKRIADALEALAARP